MNPRHSLVAAALWLFALRAPVQAQYTFTTNTDGTLNISAYTGSGGAITIPDTYNGLPITSVGYAAFRLSGVSSVSMGANLTSIGIYGFDDCYGLKTVTFGPNLTSIGNSAFSSCSVLRTVAIPDSVTTLGVDVFMSCPKLYSASLGNGVPSLPAYTFNSCTSLTNLFLGRSVASIGNAVFTQCPLQAVTVDGQNPFYCSVNGVLFDKQQTLLILFPPGQHPSSYTIPESVVTIGPDAFYGCTSLTRIVLPDRVTDLDTSAFSACSGLTSVTFGKSVARLGTSAFQGCTGLTSVTLPDSVTSIGQYAFYNCTGLTNVMIGRGITTIVGGAFLSCSSLQGVYFTGNAPSSSESFSEDGSATAYYLPGTSGWSARFGDPYGLPTAPWWLPNPQVLPGAGFGVQTNGFGFVISWATNVPVVVEACTNLAGQAWSAVSTNNLVAGAYYFSDPQWTNYPRRFYRVRSP